MRTKYVSVLIVHVSNVHVGVWSGTIDAPRGVKILEDIIEVFDKRFGDGTHIIEFREGHGRQPCGYTQVCCV